MDIGSMKTVLLFVSLFFAIHNSASIRCFECRSDIQRSCGNPFNPNHAPSVECSHQSTKPTVMCFKASQYVGFQFVTVRGCAPFNTDTFSQGFQRGMAGTYWRGKNHFSLCDYDNCNSSSNLKLQVPLLALPLIALINCLRN